MGRCAILSVVDIWLMTFFLFVFYSSKYKIDIWPLSLYSKIFVLITQNLISYFTISEKISEWA